MRTLDVVVAVPGTVVELHKAHALLDEFAGEQALAAKRIRGVLADAVGFLRLRVLLLEVNDLRHLHLHADGELVVVHARLQFVVSRVLLGVFGV